MPQKLSERFHEFFAAINRCTAKGFMFLDTMPEMRRGAFSPGSHWIDTFSNPNVNILMIDALRIHETVLAHELGHAWVQYVDGCEDHGI